MADQIKKDFSVETRFGVYSDALYFDADQWPVDDATLEAMKQERVDKWIALLTAPGTPCEDCPEVDTTPIPEGNG